MEREELLNNLIAGCKILGGKMVTPFACDIRDTEIEAEVATEEINITDMKNLKQIFSIKPKNIKVWKKGERIEGRGTTAVARMVFEGEFNSIEVLEDGRIVLLLR
jgi:hypothetical protein